jgi:hypothetical protein
MKLHHNEQDRGGKQLSSAVACALAYTLLPSRLPSQQHFNFTIAAVGAFGEPLTGCRVESFRSTDTAVGKRHDYKDRFQDLVAQDIPGGEYEAEIVCREARIGKWVKVSASNGFEVVSENRRITRSDHKVPHLAIRIDGSRRPGETWWITLRGVYQERSDTAEFQTDTGEARISDPDPGSYMVNVLSSTGYNCLREIDLVERTRLWTFDPAACSFYVDAYAHVVTDEDKRALKTTSWYQQLRKSDDEFWHALEKAEKHSHSQR